MAKSANPKKIVLAYSGGLDTSVILPWLKDRVATQGNDHQLFLTVHSITLPLSFPFGRHDPTGFGGVSSCSSNPRGDPLASSLVEA